MELKTIIQDTEKKIKLMYMEFITIKKRRMLLE